MTDNPIPVVDLKHSEINGERDVFGPAVVDYIALVRGMMAGYAGAN